jgi:hypothetical protein
MWLKQLMIAVSQEDMKLLEKLLDEVPQFRKKEDLESAVILLYQAKEIIEKKKDTTFQAMKQMKKNIDFLNSATADKTAKFDITS